MSDARAIEPRMTVVVATRNRRAELLQSLARHEAAVIVVDNASTDGSPEAVRAEFPHVDVVALDRNLGAVARNLGVLRAATPYVAFADDDSWWAPGSLSAAADVLDRHADLAVAQARILVGPSERLDPVCAEMAASGLPDGDHPGRALIGFVACGAAVRVSAFLACGGFDRVVRFPGEEERLALDLCDAGWAMSYLPHLTVHHHPSPKRDASHTRVRDILRGRLLTAVMRRSWLTVAGEVVGCLRAGRPGLRAIGTAIPRLPAAVRNRRPVGHRALAALRDASTPRDHPRDVLTGPATPASTARSPRAGAR
ncbi:glycosyltransferase family 2 protein [Cumulibacter manganitolerans]|uniref:glycosyltransferase family 2 protein n=1 Tax=Cumulibacter manganitolerans TaxID=1884992 RepID=UPI001294F696|nr:glycosyltransferase [Cumulibacter manganitolerans]